MKPFNPLQVLLLIPLQAGLVFRHAPVYFFTHIIIS